MATAKNRSYFCAVDRYLNVRASLRRRLHAVVVALVLGPLAGTAFASEIMTLPSIRSGNAIRLLRDEISQNVKSSMRGQGLAVPIRFARYTVAKDDNFYRIVTSTHQDPDTLASLNHLAAAADLAEGDQILIHNARGIFREEGGPMSVYIPDAKMHFFAGLRFHPEESKIFRGNDFVYPLHKFIVTSSYGTRLDPFTNKQTFHGGMDLAAPEGTPVLASRPGKVVFCGNLGGYGNLVVLDHGHGYRTLYGHLKAFTVKRGAMVAAGAQIATVGSTGRSTGPHLHFEMRKDGQLARPRLVHDTTY
ncbi:MAG TPA: M23 family metallopeptidase [Leptospiraceae bacterium]|nr:M23 family metallopeptidase [Leptospiraceae bacterium]